MTTDFKAGAVAGFLTASALACLAVAAYAFILLVGAGRRVEAP